MKVLKLLLLSCLPISIVFGQVHRGFVYEDHNQNNKFDRNEKGLVDIRISDGYSIAKTQADGSFSIQPHPNARFLFITTPSGYKNIDKHYVPVDTGKNTAYTFGLTIDESQSTEHLRFIQITDTETPLYGPWVDNIRNYAKQQDVSLLMHTGDICYIPGMQFHAAQINTDLMGVPTHYAVGNHDLVAGEYGEKQFEALFGPTYYSFEAGPVHFVVTPMAGGDYKPSYTTDQVIRWLKQDLALKDKNKPLIYINHDFSTKSSADYIIKGETEEINLLDYQLAAWLYGHWHNNFVFRNKGVYVVGTNAPNKGGIDNAPGQFLVIDVTPEGIKNIKPVYTNIRSHLQVMTPQSNHMTLINENKLAVHVNAYDSEQEIENIEVNIYNGKGNRIAEHLLSASSDWHWQATVPFSHPMDEQYELLLTVRYGNGKEEIHREYFCPTPGEEKKHLKLQWTTAVGGNIWKASPLLIGEQLILGTMDDNQGGQQGIYALNRNTGVQEWRYSTTNAIKHKLCYQDGIVVASDVETNIYALDVRTGKAKWTLSPPDISIPTFVSGSALHNGIYYSRLGSKIGAWHVHNGEQLWSSNLRGGESTAAAWTVQNKMLYTGINWMALYAYDSQTGAPRWKRGEDGLRFRSGGVTLQDDTLYTTGLNELLKLNPKTGETIQKVVKEDDFKVMANPLLVDDLWIMPTSTNDVKAYDNEYFSQIKTRFSWID